MLTYGFWQLYISTKCTRIIILHTRRQPSYWGKNPFYQSVGQAYSVGCKSTLMPFVRFSLPKFQWNELLPTSIHSGVHPLTHFASASFIEVPGWKRNLCMVVTYHHQIFYHDFPQSSKILFLDEFVNSSAVAMVRPYGIIRVHWSMAVSDGGKNYQRIMWYYR